MVVVGVLEPRGGLRTGGASDPPAPTDEGGSPVDGPTQWTVPADCTLGYALDADIQMASGGRPGQGLTIDADLSMDRRGDRMVIHQDRWRVGFAGRPGTEEPPGNLAEVRLASADGAMVEHDGHTAMWSAYRSFPGLVVFFPRLGSGSAWTWDLTLHTVATAEFERGAADAGSARLPVDQPWTTTVDVTRGPDTTVHGMPAVQLQTAWSIGPVTGNAAPREGLPAAASTQSATAQGTHTVLASGQLYEATVERTTETSMKMGDLGGLDQTMILTTHLQLVRGCDGPTDLATADPPEPHAAALAQVQAMRNRLVEGDLDAVLASFDAAVLQAHGRDAVLAALGAYRTAPGVRAFGAPEIAFEVELDGVDLRIEMVGQDEEGVSTITVLWVHPTTGKVKRWGTTNTQPWGTFERFDITATVLEGPHPRR